jgi:hypothetical protein
MLDVYAKAKKGTEKNKKLNKEWFGFFELLFKSQNTILLKETLS